VRTPHSLLRTTLRWASPAGRRGRLSVLIFHRVVAQADPLFPDEPDPARFDDVCRWLRAWFNVLPLDDAVRRLREGALPDRALCITFDDGYADNVEVALPVLARHRLSATFFIATGFLDGGRMWNDTIIEAVRSTSATSVDLGDDPDLGSLERMPLSSVADRRETLAKLIGACKYLGHEGRIGVAERLARRLGARLPDDLMMSSAQVQELARAGMQVGAHTVSHPILAKLDDDTIRCEMRGSRQCLETLLDRPVTLFAYPNGKPGKDYDRRGIGLARQTGFDAAFSTAHGAADARSDPFELPRFTPWDRGRIPFGLRLLRNLAQAPARSQV
jgi:peptidoglycan/xylan/chitin deacetylase (PgdA/CDA1 family)